MVDPKAGANGGRRRGRRPRADLLRGNRERLAALARRSRNVLLLSGVVGILTGAAVTAFDWVTRDQVFHHLRRAPLAVQLGAPVVGLLAVNAVLRWVVRGASPLTTDAYIRNFHTPEERLDPRLLPGRLLASVLTLGLGGAMGYEGPAMYLGAAIGSTLQGRLSRYFDREDAKVLLVAGAAAGVAAIFKAPATGVVFALEVPYQDDLARRMLLPASIAAAASYLIFVLFAGTKPLFVVGGAAPIDFRDLAGAAALGVLAGVGARLFSRLLQFAKRLATGPAGVVRASAAGVTLAVIAAVAARLFGAPITLGAGYETLRWALDPTRAVVAVVVLLGLRTLATAATVAGGGVGGLFIPLVVEGGLLGRALGGLFGAPRSTLFPLIGVAAFLGAGYRTPLAGVMFVAESTGRPGFVVPGLVAAVVAQLFMGRVSVSPYQVASRAGHLERRLALPLSAALRTDLATAPPDCTVAEFFWNHLVPTRQRSVPVVDGTTYLGMARLSDLREVPQERWESTRVSSIMRTDLPVGRVDWLLREAVAAMERADVDRLPVTDAHGRFVGVVTTSQILKLADILDEAEGPPVP